MGKEISNWDEKHEVLEVAADYKSGLKHGIVIPCYNESSRLSLDSFIKFAEANKGSIICFVNDGSSDETRTTLANIKNTVSDNVHICHVSKNAGKANAVKTGSWYLYRETSVDTIGFLDADLSTSFSEYEELISTLDNDKDKRLVFGSRNMEGEGTTIERNPLRKLLSNIIRCLIFLICRLRIKDTQCGAKVFHRSLIPIAYSGDFCTKWLFDVEILLRLKKEIGVSGFRRIFIEKPLSNWIHMDGSKLNFKDSVMIPYNLLKIWLSYDLMPFISWIGRTIRYYYQAIFMSASHLKYD